MNGIEIDQDFESGNIDDVEELDPLHFSCKARKDTSWRPLWFYFRLKNAAEKEITIEIANAKECLGGSHSWIKARPVFSYDQKNWDRIINTIYSEDSGIFSFKQKFQGDTVWVAFCYPYTYKDLKNYLSEIEKSPYVTVDVIGKTGEGRNLYVLTLTESSSDMADRFGVWAVARQHAGETPGSYTVKGMINFLLSADELASKIRKRFVYKIVPMVDIDGVCKGVYGKGSKPADFADEDWRPNPIHPEIAAIRKAIQDYTTSSRYDVFIDFHAPSGGDVNYFAIGSDAWGRLHQEQKRFMSLVEKSNPELYSSEDFVEWDEDPTSTLGFSVIDQYKSHGMLVLAPETSYNQNRLGQYMTPSLMCEYGKAIARAIWDYFWTKAL